MIKFINGIREKWRWWLIYKLDKNPEYCWADLVTWAIYLKSYRELKECKNLYCPENGPYAYCGKCEQNGKMEKYKEENK